MMTARTPVLGLGFVQAIIGPLISLGTTGLTAYLEKERDRKAELEARRAASLEAQRQAAVMAQVRAAEEAARMAQATGGVFSSPAATTSTVVPGVPDLALYAGGAGLLALLFFARR